jgi:hypothetical protein
MKRYWDVGIGEWRKKNRGNFFFSREAQKNEEKSFLMSYFQ